MNIDEQNQIIRERVRTTYTSKLYELKKSGMSEDEAKALALERAREVERECRRIRDEGAHLPCTDCGCEVPPVGKYFKLSLRPLYSWESVFCNECSAVRGEKVKQRNERLRREGNPLAVWLHEYETAIENGTPRPKVPELTPLLPLLGEFRRLD